jgi:tRNA-modifying protein YgfZ
MIIHPMNTPLNGLAPLTHLGVIRVEGEEAAKFLQGQLTQDFALLGQSEARLAAFCSAKGRMQASFIGFKRNEHEILLVCSLDLLTPTLKRLSMFVLRAKARLSDATADFALYGLAGSALIDIAGEAYSPWTKADLKEGNLVHLYPCEATPRALLICPTGQDAPQAPPLAEALWRWSEVMSGVATLSAPVVDAFVPQMLNFESVGGVNFKKGCYPGQEVVARSQFRGTLKRRTYLAWTPANAQVGQAVFHAEDTEQPCGTVVQVAESPQNPDGGSQLLVSMQISAAQSPDLYLSGEPTGQARGGSVTLLPLPYPLLEDL